MRSIRHSATVTSQDPLIPSNTVIYDDSDYAGQDISPHFLRLSSHYPAITMQLSQPIPVTLYWWFPRCGMRIPRDRRPVSRGWVDTLP
jgi:hypothetical protein